jgi:hypothetical protein
MSSLEADLAVDDDPPQVWPRIIEDGGIELVIYEPQVEAWTDTRVVARAAVAIETAASPEPHFGTIWIAARALVSKEDHVVVLEDPRIMRSSFPTASDRGDEWVALIGKHLLDVRVLELDRVETSLAAAKLTTAVPKDLALNNDPPPIFFATCPSLLVLIDGPPVERRVPGTSLLRTINTRALILEQLDESPAFFLAIGSYWLAASSLDGPWTLAPAPDGGERAKNSLAGAKLVDLHENDPEIIRLLQKGEVPGVFVCTRPAELIVTNGEPKLAPVAGTKLDWAKNTDADIFVDTSTERRTCSSGVAGSAPGRATARGATCREAGSPRTSHGYRRRTRRERSSPRCPALPKRRKP